MGKRILLMYISDVSGHHSATLAIEGAIRSLDKEAVTSNINSLAYTTPLGGKIVHKMYMGVIKKFPNFWGWMYDNPRVINFLEPVKNSLHKRKTTKIEWLLNNYQPDVAVFSQAFPCGMVAHYKKLNNLKLPLIAVLTDYAPHSYWIHDEVDYYVVPVEDAREKLMAKGVESSKIKVLGIPIDSKFAIEHNRELLCEQFGLDPRLKTILLMGGGHGLGPIDTIAQRLSGLDEDFQMVALAGVNKEISKKLNILKKQIRKKMLVFDYANNVDELMDIADIVITKAGGLTTAEALAKGLAMVVIKPIPGQEINNTRFLNEKNIALCVNNLDEVLYSVKDLINNEGKLNALKAKTKEFARPSASVDIARLILNS